MKLHFKPYAVIRFYIASNEKVNGKNETVQIVGRVAEMTDDEVIIYAQKFIAKDYITDRKTAIRSFDLYAFQTIDTGRPIHIGKDSVVAWQYYEVPTDEINVMHTDFVTRDELRLGKYLADKINVYHYKTGLCEGYGEYYE